MQARFSSETRGPGERLRTVGVDLALQPPRYDDRVKVEDALARLEVLGTETMRAQDEEMSGRRPVPPTGSVPSTAGRAGS
jgi:hypothetical protein